MKLTCHHPILIWEDPDNHKGAIQVPCGKCLACRRKRSLDWTTRCVFESRTCGSDNCCFVTLTYACAPDNGLVKSHLQSYLKRIRSRFAPRRIRFFACGEYGSIGKRPHYHLILFGVSKDDMLSHDDAWPYGFVSIGYATEQSIAYTCGYCNKLEQWPDGATPCFRLMSRKPGLGLQYFLSNRDDIIRLYHVLPRYLDDKLYQDDDLRLAHKEFRRSYFLKKYHEDIKCARELGYPNVLSYQRQFRWQLEQDFRSYLSLRRGLL